MADHWRRVAVSTTELSEGLNHSLEKLRALCDRHDTGGAWVLARVYDQAIGWVRIDADDVPSTPDELQLLIEPAVHQRALTCFSDAGVRLPDRRLPVDVTAALRVPPYMARQERARADGPDITAIICTRDRPDGLARCLESLQSQDYPRLAILVVDNAATRSAAESIARASEGPHVVSYVHEERPGLSWARNRSLDSTDSDIMAWIDDDEIADKHWVVELAAEFMENSSASVVCGLMLPAELETRAQELFETYGGHSKGRGFERAVFSPATKGQQHPLLPLPPFGTGGNMAMRRQALQLFHRFDTALGVGTRSRGAEDTRALSEILLAGGSVCYQPGAITWHFHRRDMAGFERQLHGYGVGLAAFYLSMVVDHPLLVIDLLKLAPTAIGELMSPRGTRLNGITEDFPNELLRAHHSGLLKGPGEYLAARWRSRRLAMHAKQ